MLLASMGIMTQGCKESVRHGKSSSASMWHGHRGVASQSAWPGRDSDSLDISAGLTLP